VTDGEDWPQGQCPHAVQEVAVEKVVHDLNGEDDQVRGADQTVEGGEHGQKKVLAGPHSAVHIYLNTRKLVKTNTRVRRYQENIGAQPDNGKEAAYHTQQNKTLGKKDAHFVIAV